MHIIALFAGFLMIGIILIDAFETIILPRRISRPYRLSRVFQDTTWRIWLGIAKVVRHDTPVEGGDRRDRFLAVFGPLVLLLLLAFWAAGLVLGYALVHWGLGDQLQVADGEASFGTIVYMSGTTFFTLGLGDVAPATGAARVLTVAESATGFSFLAAVISYLPVIYGAFATREVNITMLDARAGSPPSAGAILRRFAEHDSALLDGFLREWERWSAELLESHLSYPVLSFFRSQHEQQSWLGALTMVLDACALLIVGIERDEDSPPSTRQARLTFAMARHAVGDLSQVLGAQPDFEGSDRLPSDQLVALRRFLAEAGVPLREGQAANDQLAAIRQLYEPYVVAVARHHRFVLPPWIPSEGAADDWQTTAWQQDKLDVVRALDPDHFEPRT